MNLFDDLDQIMDDNDKEILKQLDLSKRLLNIKMKQVSAWSDTAEYKQMTHSMIVDLLKDCEFLITMVSKGRDQTMEEIDECLEKLPKYMSKVNKLQEFLPD